MTNNKKQIKWSEDEMQFLRSNHEDMSAEHLAKLLNRTIKSITCKLNIMSLTKALNKNKFIVNDKDVNMLICDKNNNIIGSSIIDIRDLDVVLKYRWYISNGYVVTSYDKKTLSLHRLLLNPPKDMAVDHINGDRVDNRRCNLRIVTDFENMQNLNKPSRNNKTNILGVAYYKKYNKYRTKISVRNKCIHLYWYDTPEEAKQVYDYAKAYAHPFSPQAQKINQQDIPQWIKDKIDKHTKIKG